MWEGTFLSWRYLPSFLRISPCHWNPSLQFLWHLSMVWGGICEQKWHLWTGLGQDLWTKVTFSQRGDICENNTTSTCDCISFERKSLFSEIFAWCIIVYENLATFVSYPRTEGSYVPPFLNFFIHLAIQSPQQFGKGIMYLLFYHLGID